MILGGVLEDAPQPVTVTLVAATDNFVENITRVARLMTALDVQIEVYPLTVDQVWTLLYVRGGMDPEFAEPDARDHYLRALLKLRGEKGRAAVTGFLAGWTQHRGPVEPVEAFAWHRWMADTELQVAVCEGIA